MANEMLKDVERLEARVERLEGLEELLGKLREADEAYSQYLRLTVRSVWAFLGWPASDEHGDRMIRGNEEAVKQVDICLRNRLWPPVHGGDFEAADAAEKGGDDA